jgi:hypothetical protein
MLSTVRYAKNFISSIGRGKTMAKKFVCRHCGNDDVWSDAWAAWSTPLQDWVVSSIQDNSYCNHCDGETHLREVPIEGQPDCNCGHDLNAGDCENNGCEGHDEKCASFVWWLANER